MTTEVKRLVADSIPPDCDQVDKFAALSLIKSGIKTGDDLVKRIGQARLRKLENRETPEDIELLES